MNEHERRCEFLFVLEELRSLGGDTVILVEGMKDDRVLRQMGVSAPIPQLKGPDVLVNTIEKGVLGYRKAVILTDWDRTGGRLAHRAKEILEGIDIEVDLRIRKELAILTSKEIRTVEALVKYMTRAQADEVATSLFNEKKSI